jgi:signal transduction histidine kinase
VRLGVALRGDEAILTVADEGPGIPEAERARVFARFERGSGTDGVEGLGLGLSLVSEVVTWHGGRVVVKSAGRTGSLFEVVLPALTDAPGAKEDGPGHDPGR